MANEEYKKEIIKQIGEFSQERVTGYKSTERYTTTHNPRTPTKVG